MEKIKELCLSRLQNEEHYKYQSDFNGLIESFTPATLKIDKAYERYRPLFEDEEEALVYVRKSAYSQLISEADVVRDATLEGLGDAIYSGTNHFNAAVKEAAKRLLVLWESYGDIANRAQTKETAAITKLVSDFRGSYAADMATASLTGWVDQLEIDNNAFDELSNSRYDEKEAKTRLRMKLVRSQVDKAHAAIVERINAMITLEDAYDFTPFVNKLNLRIDHYSTQYAQRVGRAQSAAEAKKAEAPKE